MKQYLTLIAGTLLLALAGCSRETGPSGKDSGQPIRFDVAATDVQTKAPNEVSTDALLRNKSVGVFAAYTGKVTYENTTVSPDFMYNQEVKYTDNNVWEYNPVKYWPNDPADYVSFFAYAPYEANPAEGSSTGIIGMSRKVDLGDPWINFRLPATIENQVDLLYGQKYDAATGQYTCWLDQQKANWGDPNGHLKFVFRHALACMGDIVSVKLSDELYAELHGELDLTINRISIEYSNLTNKARLVLRSVGSPNWKEIISGELTCSRTYNSAEYSGKTFSKDASANPGIMSLESGHGLFYIPLQIAGVDRPQMVITVFYTVTGPGTGTLNGSFSDSASSTISFNTGDPGTKQGIVLTLTSGINLEADIVTSPAGIGMPGDITPETGF